jgi:UDP-N-acetylglucosamine:LPS N-acetylglucosamine transferase
MLTVATLPYKLGELLRSPDRLAALRANARLLARPRAAFDIARHVMNLADRTRESLDRIS